MDQDDAMSHAQVGALVVTSPLIFTAQWQSEGGGSTPEDPDDPETPKDPDDSNEPGATGPDTGDERYLPWLMLLTSGLAVIVIGSSILRLNVRDRTG
jgi:hypothetical protein